MDPTMKRDWARSSNPNVSAAMDAGHPRDAKQEPSPIVLKKCIPFCADASARIALCRASTRAIPEDPSPDCFSSHALVLPSMSVNRKVTVPVGCGRVAVTR